MQPSGPFWKTHRTNQEVPHQPGLHFPASYLLLTCEPIHGPLQISCPDQTSTLTPAMNTRTHMYSAGLDQISLSSTFCFEHIAAPELQLHESLAAHRTLVEFNAMTRSPTANRFSHLVTCEFDFDMEQSVKPEQLYMAACAEVSAHD